MYIQVCQFYSFISLTGSGDQKDNAMARQVSYIQVCPLKQVSTIRLLCAHPSTLLGRFRRNHPDFFISCFYYFCFLFLCFCLLSHPVVHIHVQYDTQRCQHGASVLASSSFCCASCSANKSLYTRKNAFLAWMRYFCSFLYGRRPCTSCLQCFNLLFQMSLLLFPFLLLLAPLQRFPLCPHLSLLFPFLLLHLQGKAKTSRVYLCPSCEFLFVF